MRELGALWLLRWLLATGEASEAQGGAKTLLRAAAADALSLSVCHPRVLVVLQPGLQLLQLQRQLLREPGDLLLLREEELARP
jgi:hypothetical protein